MKSKKREQKLDTKTETFVFTVKYLPTSHIQQLKQLYNREV